MRKELYLVLILCIILTGCYGGITHKTKYSRGEQVTVSEGFYSGEKGFIYSLCTHGVWFPIQGYYLHGEVPSSECFPEYILEGVRE